MMLSKVLEEIGLNQSEIKVYLALLELGEAKSGEILMKAGLNSGRIYEIFDSLLKKGFISYVIKSGTKYFSPANPKKILEYIENKEESVIKQKEEFKSLLPNILEKLESQKGETKVEIYIGLNGIKSAYEKELEYIRKTGFVNILGVTSRENYSKKVYNFFVFNQQPRRKKIKSKIKKILNFKTTITVPEGIKEIKEAIENGIFSDPDSIAYRNS